MADFMTLAIGYMVFFLLSSYIILCGDSEFHRDGVIGKMHNAVVKMIAFIFYVCFPEKMQQLLRNVITYLFFKKNHCIQALYLAIFSGVLWVFATKVHPMAVALGLPTVHIITPYAAMAVNLALYATCCWSDAGVITTKNHHRYARLFPYDGVLYIEGLNCRTCKFAKPARSKHCTYCDHCVYRFDHHCSWVNNCIGGRNVRFFLLLLISIIVLITYVSYVMGCMLQAAAARSGLWDASYLGPDGNYHRVNMRIVFQHLFMQLPAVVFLLTSLLLLSILIVFFLLYHLFLLASNQTTNERFKRSKVKGEVVKLKKSQSPRTGKKSGRGSSKEREESGRRWTRESPITVTRSYSRGFWGNLYEVIMPP